MAMLDSRKRNDLQKRSFAFPKERKEPLEDASHVRNAVARFNQVKGVSDAERAEAWKRERERELRATNRLPAGRRRSIA